jgi:DNA-binding MarR family transcriptional regulator
MSRSIRLEDVDLGEVAQCTCLRVRNVARSLTRAYDAALAPVALTIGQFGLLARLYGRRHTVAGVAIGELAELIGVDPTTVNRLLKPLEREGLVAEGQSAPDRRVRTVKISRKGAARLQRALPLWREAERSARSTLGAREAEGLDALLDATSKIGPHSAST